MVPEILLMQQEIKTFFKHHATQLYTSNDVRWVDTEPTPVSRGY